MEILVRERERERVCGEKERDLPVAYIVQNVAPVVDWSEVLAVNWNNIDCSVHLFIFVFSATTNILFYFHLLNNCNKLWIIW